MCPYEVVTAFDNGSVEIKTIDGSQTSFVVNGHRIRLYHQQKEMALVEEEVIPPPDS